MPLHENDFRPRKKPLQSRSTVTVEAILEATVRILERAQDARFTTKQVAEVAGVSVGSLYQYFPNKQALVSELVRRKLTHLVAITRAACDDAPEGAREAIAHVIDGIITEKRKNERWRALKVVTQTVDVQVLVRQHVGEISDEILNLLEARIRRPLSAAEGSRLVIAFDAVEGALSQIVKTAPAKLQDDGVSETFTRMFIATLDLPEIRA
jgi:AcrR family transcriptional regulator